MANTVPESVTHVMVSFSSVLLAEIDKYLPPKSVLIIDEPDVVISRRVRERVAEKACVAAVFELPLQDMLHALALGKLVKKPSHLQAVIPATEYGVLAAASLASMWGVPGLGIEAAQVFCNKASLRATAENSAIRQPAWKACTNIEQAHAFFERNPGGCVLKPTDRQGSLGVTLVDTGDHIDRAWGNTRFITETLRSSRDSDDSILIESRLRGREVSVESLVQKGVSVFMNVTEKKLFPGAHPVESGHVLPAVMSAELLAKLAQAVTELIDVCRVDTGILHSEWMLIDDVPYLIECAGRLPGDGITELLSMAYGFSFIETYIALLEGRNPGFALNIIPRASAIQFLSASPGLVTSVEGVDDARSLEGIDKVSVSVKPGDVAVALESSNSRLGHIIGTASNVQSVEALMSRAEKLVHIYTEGTEGLVDA